MSDCLADHQDVVEKVIEILKTMETFGYRPEEIHYKDTPFTGNPVRGLIVSPMNELEGDSLNETQDIGFPVMVVRAGHKLSNFEFTERDHWRRAIFRKFNRVRIGVDGCELITRVKHLDIKIPKEAAKHHLDASALVVTTWVRQQHNGNA